MVGVSSLQHSRAAQLKNQIAAGLSEQEVHIFVDAVIADPKCGPLRYIPNTRESISNRHGDGPGHNHLGV